jgi:hypothetical protein
MKLSLTQKQKVTVALGLIGLFTVSLVIACQTETQENCAGMSGCWLIDDSDQYYSVHDSGSEGFYLHDQHVDACQYACSPNDQPVGFGTLYTETACP